MARIRSIHPSLTTDENFMSMSIGCKAFWPLLWMECDDKGIFEWKPVVLKARLFPADQIDISALLQELVQLGCVMHFVEGGKAYGAVRNFCKFQRPKKPTSVHPISLEAASFTAFKGISSLPVPNQGVSGGENPSLMEDEGGVEEDEVRKEEPPAQALADKPKPDRDPGFDVFWTSCPRKVGKGSAQHAYRNALKKTSPETLAAAMRVFAAKQAGNDPKFIPHPASWLNDERWLDEDLKPISGQVGGVPVQVFVPEGSDAFKAWEHAMGKKYPAVESRDHGHKRGWMFPTEFPPINVSRETTQQGAS